MSKAFEPLIISDPYLVRELQRIAAEENLTVEELLLVLIEKYHAMKAASSPNEEADKLR